MRKFDEDPAQVRRRRIEQRRAERCCDALEKMDHSKRPRLDSSDASDTTDNGDHSSCRLVPSVRGIKRQTRYEPGVPMTKEELVKWRKEARRVRNRESAAASRQKTRERIHELEGEVSGLQAELEAARSRIAELEALTNSSNHAVSGNEIVSKDLVMEGTLSHLRPQVSPAPSPLTSPMSSPVYAPSSLAPDDFPLDLPSPHGPASILPNMISRPTAV